MTDSIERIISETGNFFGIACNTSELVSEACRNHDVGPLAAAALARALTAAILAAALLKDGQSVQLRFQGNGPLQKIITEAGYDGWARGYIAAPHAEIALQNGRLDVAGGIGKAGLLTVTKTISPGKSYTGTIPLFTSEIGEDLAYYYSQSEQTPSAVALSVHLEANGGITSGGFLIQSLPPADESLLSIVERRISSLPPLTEFLSKDQSPGKILDRLFGNIPHKKIGSKALRYSCSCSREKMEGALVSLGEEDLKELNQSQGSAEVHCEFCRQAYHFSKEALEEILKNFSNRM